MKDEDGEFECLDSIAELQILQRKEKYEICAACEWEQEQLKNRAGDSHKRPEGYLGHFTEFAGCLGNKTF